MALAAKSTFWFVWVKLCPSTTLWQCRWFLILGFHLQYRITDWVMQLRDVALCCLRTTQRLATGSPTSFQHPKKCSFTKLRIYMRAC